MKANKAPEKIYVHIKYKPCEITFSEVIEKECSNIEYIRKDAFIEKACSWFADRYQANGSYLCADDIEDFEKYIRG